MIDIKGIIARSIPIFLLFCLMHGVVPDLSNYPVNQTELKHNAGATMCENGNTSGKTEEEIVNDAKRILYTSSVIENRKNSSKWKGSTTEEVILAKEGKYWQYASTTRNNFRSIKYTEYVEACCHYILYFGPIIPENVVYQGQGSNGKEYARIPVRGDKDEVFCYE